ncbi:Alpha/Beta hydrolase protein [Aspergillus cavernicola]|uniref:Alpha/Beta hydrolase protein n=1 Tax=Aspergillus cavernicola TaxID=176166 RepID=A0ABR4IB86_9EURO
MSTITEHEVVYADEKKIHYLAAGPPNGPLILFIHGWPASAITWQTQLNAFAALGFRAIAPDMPGFGQSSARRVVTDYSQEALVGGMMALLSDTGRTAAIWVGHDWGAGVTSSVAAHHPEAIKALVNICVPYRSIELGWEGFLPFVNREIYPAHEYEFGQWDYMKKFEEDFESTIEWFEKDTAGFCKAAMQKASPPSPNRVEPMMSGIRKNGWMGGASKPPSVSLLGDPFLPPDVFATFVQDMERTGFWPGCAYYLNHQRNASYNGQRDGKLTKPVLFIHAAWDTVCETQTSRLCERMRAACRNLTEVRIEGGHFLQYERAGEVHAALIRFILTEIPGEWPGFWDSAYTNRKSLV